MENGDVAPGWVWVGDMTEKEFGRWFDQREQEQCGHREVES